MCLIVANSSHAQSSDEMRILVAEAGSTELQLVGQLTSGRLLSQADVDLDSIEQVNSFALWRATLNNVDHWHWYLLAAEGGKLYRLGGFQAPELLAFAGALGDPGPGSIQDRSFLLARLGDPEGAINVALESRVDRSPAGDSAIAKWKSFRPESWPRDTVLRLGDGGVLVRMTLLSERTKAMTAVWVPSLNVFLYDANRRLVAWSRREGAPFGRRQLSPS
jgi:hypothetical protein